MALLRPHWQRLSVAICVGIMGGLSITALLATINTSLHAEGGLTSGLLAAFAGFCILSLVGSILSDMGANAVGQHVIARLRQDLGRKILRAPIDQLERYRAHRLIPVVTHDVDVISDFAFCFAPLSVAFTVTLGCLTYLAILSPVMFLATVSAVIFGSIIQYKARLKGIAGFHEARELEDEMQKTYRSLSEGAKELRLNRTRRQDVHARHLERTAEDIRDVQLRSINLFVVAKGLGSSLFFIVVGVALAVQSVWPSADSQTLSGFVLVMLYMKGPLEHLVTELPIVTRAQVAFRRIAALSEQFATPEPDLLLAGGVTPLATVPEIRLEGVSYAFPTPEGGDPFKLGPLSLTIEPGSLLFIVGDNGSGKTTLIKILLGLYKPTEGAVVWNDEPVTDACRDDYRQQFTTVFSDFFLFEEVGCEGNTRDGDPLEQVTPVLTRLELDHKVAIVDGRFSTTDLSTGQRKRLALIQAWLDGRPVLVFDEWAADQDPTFRQVFYTEILPELKAMGKTIIAISHDDRYFHVADRVVRLRGGHLVDDGRPAAATAVVVGGADSRPEGAVRV